MITQERLKDLFSYDALTGDFTRLKTSKAGRAGSKAGCIGADGYVRIMIDRKIYRGHRLAWLYMFGGFTAPSLDHIDGNRANNAIANLRECTQSQNSANVPSRTKSKLKGAFNSKRGGKEWYSKIQVSKKIICLGYYYTEAEAHEAYVAAAKKHFGEFARTGVAYD